MPSSEDKANYMVNDCVGGVIHMAQKSTSDQKAKFSLYLAGYHFYELHFDQL